MTTKNFGRDDLMAVAAFRYCLGRSSYIVGDCADWLTDQWQNITPNMRHVIERDLREAIARDDQSRQDRTEHHALGMDMGRAVWLEVLVMIEAQRTAPSGATGG